MGKPIKVKWNKGETLLSFYKKMLMLKGCKVINKRDFRNPYTISHVSRIRTWIRPASFSHGIKERYFSVIISITDARGVTAMNSHAFPVPRTNNRKKDLRQKCIITPSPFVYYWFEKNKI